MYVPEHFALTTADCRTLLTGVTVGDLITTGAQGISATFVPMLFDPDEGEFGTLIGHLSRVNPQWQDQGEALFVLHGPDDYVAAEWLSLPEAPSVPTWNYVTVQARGSLIVHEERDWNDEAVRRLSLAMGERSVDELPEDAVERMLRAVVGVEVRITGLLGKAKMSQNKNPQIVRQVIDGLRRSGGSATADWMAERSLPRAVQKAEMLARLREQKR